MPDAVHWTTRPGERGTVWSEARVGGVEVWVQYDPRSGAARYGYFDHTLVMASGSTVAYADSESAARTLALEKARARPAPR